MNKVELAAQRVDRDLKPLDRTALLVAPVLTPVIFAATAGIVAGAVVGYVDRQRHGFTQMETGEGTQVDGDIREMSIGELLQTRQDALSA